MNNTDNYVSTTINIGENLIHIPLIGTISLSLNPDGTLELRREMTDEEIFAAKVKQAKNYYQEYFKQRLIGINITEYNGIEIYDLENNQRLEAYEKTMSVLNTLSNPPNDLIYSDFGFIAVWQVPQERQFLDSRNWSALVSNVLNYVKSLNFGAPEIAFMSHFYEPDVTGDSDMLHEYEYVINPLRKFDETFGISITVTKR